MYNNMPWMQWQKDWEKSGKQMMDMWSNFYSPTSEKEKEGEKTDPFIFFTNMFKQQQDYMKNFSDPGMMFSNDFVKSSYDRFTKSMKVYNTLYSFWSNIITGIPKSTDVDEWNRFIKKTTEGYSELADTFTQSFLPEEFSQNLIKPAEYYMVYETMMNFFRPWLENSPELSNKLFLALSGNRLAYNDFVKGWNDLTKDTISKSVNPQFAGANKEMMEKALKNLDAFIDYSMNLEEFNNTLKDLSVKSMEKVMKDIMELSKDGLGPNSFMEFYTLWSKNNESAFEELFKTDSFSKIMNDTMAAGFKLKKGIDEMIQDQISLFPIPGRKEMDAVEKEVYELRKKVKDLTKEVNRMKEQMESHSDGGNE